MNQERSGKKGQESLPADLVKNKEALNRLARSGDAQRLMELLHLSEREAYARIRQAAQEKDTQNDAK